MPAFKRRLHFNRTLAQKRGAIVDITSIPRLDQMGPTQTSLKLNACAKTAAPTMGKINGHIFKDMAVVTILFY
jgi:hypothetical protein